MFYQIFLSPQVKLCAIITYINGICKFPHELPNDGDFWQESSGKVDPFSPISFPAGPSHPRTHGPGPHPDNPAPRKGNPAISPNIPQDPNSPLPTQRRHASPPKLPTLQAPYPPMNLYNNLH